MKKTFLYLFAVLVLAFSCKEEKKSDYKKVDSTEVNGKDIASEYPGKKIMETECNLCHNPIAPEDSRLAPPMIAIKRRYIPEGTTKEQFQADLIRWINDPSEEISKMPGALEKFGIMPLQPYPEKKIKEIADYIYDNQIEEPEWFEAHYREEHGKGLGKGNGIGKRQRKLGKDSGEIGLNYALSTKAQLGKNLMKALKEKGPEGAVTFCNLKAMHLTDSMAVKHSATIKRVSDKPRNPINKANAIELEHIETFKKVVLEGEEVKPIVEELNNSEVNFYYPITTNAMCLKCHGSPNKEVTPSTLSTLKSLYPKDMALGYESGQVRGIWSIRFTSVNSQ